MKIYVGNLPYDITEQDLRQEFEVFGGVDSVSVITDKYSGRPKGFAFVEMGSKSESVAAISGLNGKTLNFKEVDCEKNESKADQFNIEGYPTIKLVKGNQVIDYDAKPEMKSLTEFLKTSV